MVNRRSFLKLSSFTLGSMLIPKTIFANEQPVVSPQSNRPVRIQGIVRAGGRPVPGVVVSDGEQVVKTGHDGIYQLFANRKKEHVFISLPSGYEIPVDDNQLASFYKRITPDHNDSMEAIFDLKKRKTDDTNHTFLALADPQTKYQEEMDEMNEEFLEDVKKVKEGVSDETIFGVSLGDIMYDDISLFPGYIDFVKKTDIPFYQVAGNHDTDQDARTNAVSLNTFKEYFGPAYYSFNVGEVHYVVLDSVFWYGGYIGYIDQEQLDWLAADLSMVEPGKTVVFFMHIPVYNKQHERFSKKKPSDREVITNRELLYAIAAPFKSYFICGHMHESEYIKEENREIHVVGAVCGAWWTGGICFDGTPRGYGVYTVNGSELSRLYKSSGEESTYQMRLYPPGYDKEHPDMLIANVWGYDESWKVQWYEEGTLMGEMDRRNAKDPLAVSLYDAEGTPEKHPWVDAVYTDHLFFAKPSGNAEIIMVEAIDGQGRKYQQSIKLGS